MSSPSYTSPYPLPMRPTSLLTSGRGRGCDYQLSNVNRNANGHKNGYFYGLVGSETFGPNNCHAWKMVTSMILEVLVEVAMGYMVMSIMSAMLI